MRHDSNERSVRETEASSKTVYRSEANPVSLHRKREIQMSLPPFGLWFYFSMLSSMGWPKRSGIFGKPSVPAVLLDITGEQLGGMGRALGAVRPAVAMRLLTQSLPDAKWPDDDLESLLMRVHREGWQSLAAYGESWKWDDLVSDPLRLMISGWFMSELWYGLTAADEVVEAFNSSLAGSRERGQRMAQHGLDIDPDALPESADQMVEQSLQMVSAYEESGGVLPLTSPSLAEYANTLRRSS